MAVYWIIKIISLFSYAITIPLIGYTRAWTAKKMGDDTPEQLGFLTLDPIAHYSWIWIAFMIIFSDRVPFGFGQYIPLYIHNFRKPYRSAKLILAYFSDAIASFVLALMALLLFVGMYGVRSDVLIQSFIYVAVTGSYNIFAASFSSWSILFSLWLANFVLFNITLAVFSFGFNIFYLCYFSFINKDTYFGQYSDWIMLVGPLLFLLFFSNYLYNIFLLNITWLANVFGLLLGVR